MTRHQLFKLRSGATRVSTEWARRLSPQLGVAAGELLDLVETQELSLRKAVSARGASAASALIREMDARDLAAPGPDGSPEGAAANAGRAEWALPMDYLGVYTTSPAAVRVLRIIGDSMAPQYPSGDRVLVDTSQRTPSPPDIYVVWDGLAWVLKHVEVIAGRTPTIARLAAGNPAYAPYEVSIADLRIAGRVIGKWTWS